ncbi:hypothetical protein [Deinococcus sonorensis]|uniref:Uncharacterized protein n=2 Tax=Deinococcus sonorensis TaxID=309891 RepID=A0AAU7U607_9DEIO
MTAHDPGSDADLEAMFVRARTLGREDLTAADRFLAGHRARARRRRAGGLSVLLAAAAVASVIALRPSAPADLPSSAAYAAYQGALGTGW